jgi:hypothetical protein
MIHMTHQGQAIPTVPISDCAVTTPQDAIRDVLAHYERRAVAKDAMPEPSETRLRYRPEVLDALFGDSR